MTGETEVLPNRLSKNKEIASSCCISCILRVKGDNALHILTREANQIPYNHGNTAVVSATRSF